MKPKPCPFCDKLPEETEIDSYVQYAHDCYYAALDCTPDSTEVDEWNKRPIEDRLNKELKAANAKLENAEILIRIVERCTSGLASIKDVEKSLIVYRGQTGAP